MCFLPDDTSVSHFATAESLTKFVKHAKCLMFVMWSVSATVLLAELIILFRALRLLKLIQWNSVSCIEACHST